MILGLRMDRGVSAETVADLGFGDIFEWARAQELILSDARGRIVLTTRGRLLSNELFARLV